MKCTTLFDDLVISFCVKHFLKIFEYSLSIWIQGEKDIVVTSCSTEPPLTARCFSPLSGFETWPGFVTKFQ